MLYSKQNIARVVSCYTPSERGGDSNYSKLFLWRIRLLKISHFRMIDISTSKILFPNYAPVCVLRYLKFYVYYI